MQFITEICMVFIFVYAATRHAVAAFLRTGPDKILCYFDICYYVIFKVDAHTRFTR